MVFPIFQILADLIIQITKKQPKEQEITPKNQNLAGEIINLVDKILSQTDENERANLSNEIDKLVYQITILVKEKGDYLRNAHLVEIS